MSKKTIYIIIATLLGLILIGLGLYYWSTKNTTSETGGGITNVFRNFFPFGGNENPMDNEEDPGTSTNNEGEPEKPVEFIVKLRKITSEPVAGAGLLQIAAGTVVRYIEKATGHIYEVELFSPRIGRISNTTIPQVYDAVWGGKNNSLVARYLKDDNRTVDTYSLTLKETSTTTENTISGIPFPSKIDGVKVFDSSVFYLVKDNNSSYGYVSNFAGSNKKQIWSSPIAELNSQYVNAKTVALTTKPEENTDGFLYFVDTGTGAVRKVLGNIRGLSTLVSPDATQVLYLSQGDNPLMYAYDLKSRSETEISPVTFPEKCAWTKRDPAVVYCAVPRETILKSTLTNWYKGKVTLSDDIWKFDLRANTSNIVMTTSKETNEYIDVIKPVISDNDQYFVFVNKKDNSLWSLDLSR